MKNRKALRIFGYFYFAVAFTMLLTENVFAYVDPSVMTYAIQAVAGVAIAVGAFVGIYFRKAKKKISNKLGIDENKNKEVESDEIVLSNKKGK